MVVNIVKQAWEEANKMLGTDYVKDEVSSYRVGYPIYMSTVNNDDKIKDLGVRLEVAVDEKVTNIWIAALCTEKLGEEIDEEIEKEAEGISDCITLDIYDIKTYANECDKNVIFQIAVQALKKIKNAVKDGKEWRIFCNEAAVKLNETIEGCNAYLTIHLPLYDVARKWKKEKEEELVNRIKDKEKMLHSEFGRQLEDVIKKWDEALNKCDNETTKYCLEYYNAAKLALQFMYDKKYFFSRTDEYCGIISDDEEWLIKVR